MSRAPALGPALLAVLLLAGAAGCGTHGAGGQPTPAATPAAHATDTPPLVVDVERSRSAAARGVFEVRLRTSGDEVVEVTRLQLLDDRFAPMPAVPKSTTVRPGGTGVVTPIPAGEVVCARHAQAGPAMAVAFRTAGGAGEVRVPVSTAGDALLTRFHADECRRLDLLDEVGIAFGNDWTTVAPATARGTIRLSRTGARGPVLLDQVQGTVIFSLEVLGRSPAGPVLTLPAGTSATEVAVEVSAARCDPHALIESKKTYLFPMWIRRGDGPAVFLTVEPVGPARVAFGRLLTEGCHREG